ncbi:PQQ-binding-like beta-propeller repeat protein [Rosettibacter firmus]|uniref:outer membrane protein assembly factor BamB family protein n=1 Tax=Rosettibacter firmus TaxID=3111522 RepID=UPI00336BC7CD
MKKLLLIVLFIGTIINAQKINFALISTASIEKTGNYSQLDSTISRINQIDNLAFVIICGNLTSSGSEKEFVILKSSLNKLNKPYFLLPTTNDFLDANGWVYFNEFYDKKFSIRNGNKVIIGLSPSIPFTKINHYTVEDINWLYETLDTLKLSDEIFFISPLQIDLYVDNWKSLLYTLSTKNIKLIINANSNKTELRTLSGYSVFDIQFNNQPSNKILDLIITEISNDSVKIYNNDKILAVNDKTIDISKDKLSKDELKSFESDIQLNINLNTTLLTSCNWWNQKIYTADYSGLISCIDTTGKVRWEFDANGNIIGSPLIADRMFVVSTFQGDLITLSAISGEQIQSIGFEDYITTDLLSIEYKGDKELMIPKLTSSNTAIVFGTASGKIYCYDLETLQEYWVNDYCKNMITSKLLYVDNKIFYTSTDGYLYCIDARSGITIWRWKEKVNTDLSYSQILSDGKRLFVVSKDGILYAINLLLGKLEWKIENSNILQNIGISENKKFIYAISSNKEFIIISIQKQKIENKIKIDSSFLYTFSTPFQSGNNILWCDSGFVNYLNTKYENKKILFLGYAPVHPIIQISQNKFLASNIDGTITIFKLR